MISRFFCHFGLFIFRGIGQVQKDGVDNIDEAKLNCYQIKATNIIKLVTNLRQKTNP